MNIYTYLKNKTSEKVLEVVSSQMDLDDHAERTWFNPSTGAVLSNYDYIRMIVKTVLVSSNKATLKDDSQVANKIVEYFNRQKEFKYVDFTFDDNLDDTYTVRITTNFSGFREYVLGVIEWNEIQRVYVLWTGTSYSDSDSGLQNSSDIGVSYYDSLQETEADIKDEIINDFINESQQSRLN